MQEEINAIIKAAPELVKHGTELVAALKLTDIAKAILGPATNEVAERIRDEVHLYRFGRQLSCIKKAEKMAQDAGFTPKAVPLKLLFPLLESASLEEDENLHNMWSALLANASSPSTNSVVRPGFVAILREMAADEAQALNWMFEQTEDSWLVSGKRFHWSEYAEVLRSKGKGDDWRLVDNTSVVVIFQRLNSALLVRIEEDKYSLTSLGYQFLSVCHPPESA